MSLAGRSRRRMSLASSRRSSMRSATCRQSRDSTRRVTLSSLNQVRSISDTVPYEDPCGNGPNFYERVFGPTADESILVGLQTMMGLCPGNVTPDDDADVMSIRSTRSESCSPEVELGEEELNTEEDETEEESEDAPSTVYQSASRLGSRASSVAPSRRGSQCPAASSQTETTGVANQSQTDTCTIRNSSIQTAGPCVSSASSQAKCPAPESCCLCCKPREDRCCCTEPSPYPCCCHVPKTCKSAQYSKTSKSKGDIDSCCCCVGTEESEETPPCCCYSSTPSCKSKRKLKSSLKASSICSCCRTPQDSSTSSTRRCTCTCGSSSGSTPKKQVTMCCQCTTSSPSSTEDIENGKGDANEVIIRYAITKITKYFSYTTFEVMKSTGKKPKVMPKRLEGVFVLRNCTCNNT